MVEQVVIDGNNLLHAMRVHAPIPAAGRETMVKIIDRWARQVNVHVLIVFDGGAPPAGLARQMCTSRLDVKFSAPKSADDVIAEVLKTIRHPANVRVISSDTAVRREASRRRCGQTDCVQFIAELFPSSSAGHTPGSGGGMKPSADGDSPDPGDEKPNNVDKTQTDDWLRWMGFNDER